MAGAASINWAHLRLHQTDPLLRFMDGCHASAAQGLCGVRIGALDCVNSNGFHQIILIKYASDSTGFSSGFAYHETWCWR